MEKHREWVFKRFWTTKFTNSQRTINLEILILSGTRFYRKTLERLESFLRIPLMTFDGWGSEGLFKFSLIKRDKNIDFTQLNGKLKFEVCLSNEERLGDISLSHSPSKSS